VKTDLSTTALSQFVEKFIHILADSAVYKMYFSVIHSVYNTDSVLLMKTCFTLLCARTVNIKFSAMKLQIQNQLNS